MKRLLALAVLVAGCASQPPPKPLTREDVVERVKAGKSAPELIQEIQETHSRFYLTVSEVMALRDAGVPDEVIDRMLSSVWQPSAVYYRHEPYWGWHHWDDPWWPHYR